MEKRVLQAGVIVRDLQECLRGRRVVIWGANCHLRSLYARQYRLLVVREITYVVT